MRIFYSVWLLFITLMIAGCSKKPPVLQVGTNLWIGYEPLYLAQTNNYYSSGAIKFVEIPTMSEVSRSYRNGIIDAAALTLDETLHLLEDRDDFEIVLLLDTSEGSDAIIAKEGIDTVTQLASKRVAVENQSTGAYLLSRALEKNKMGVESIRLIPMGTDQHEEAWNANEIDAAVTFEPYRTRLASKGGKVIFDSSRIPNEIVDVLIVRKKVIREHPEQVQNLIEGWYKALCTIEHDPKQSIPKIAMRLDLSLSETEEAMAGIQYGTLKRNQKYLFTSHFGLEHNAQILTHYMVAHRLISKPVRVRTVLPDAAIRGFHP